MTHLKLYFSEMKPSSISSNSLLQKASLTIWGGAKSHAFVYITDSVRLGGDPWYSLLWSQLAMLTKAWDFGPPTCVKGW